MKRTITDDINYALTPKDVTALAHAIMTHTDAEVAGRQTYLRSLLAGVQIEITGKPVLRRLRGRHTRPTTEAALAALEKVNAIYYQAVLAAIPDGLDPLAKNSRTNLTRSSASTLRRAIHLGWDVLTPVGEVGKVTLSRWVSERRAPRPMDANRAQKKVGGLMDRVAEILKALPTKEARELALAASEVVAGFAGVKAPQRMTPVSLRRHTEEGVSAH